MDKIQQFEDCFEIDLNFSHIEHIYFLNSHRLLLLQAPNRYTIVDMIDHKHTSIVKQQTFPHAILEARQVYDEHYLIYVYGNELQLFDLLKGETVSSYSIGKSQIYEQQFQFRVGCLDTEGTLVFYKTSVLKSTPVTVYYDVHLLQIHPALHKIRKIKKQYQDLRHFGISCGQIVSYQITGYAIQVTFLDSGITHKINCIFNLFLIHSTLTPHRMLLHFTHEELVNQLASYEVTQKKVKKLERKERPLEPHVYYNSTGSRSIVYKNMMNHRRRDHFKGIVRVKASRGVKYLSLLSEVLPGDRNKELRQQVLNLLL